jgi:RNA polymerase-binding transcription factor DksA
MSLDALGARVDPRPGGYGRVLMARRTLDAEAIRKRLLDRRADLERVIEAAEADVALSEGRDDPLQESAGYDLDPAEGGSELIEKEKSFSIVMSAKARIEEVEAALQRLDNGSYGVCLVCERPIDPRRLEARPEAAYCVTHQPSPDA